MPATPALFRRSPLGDGLPGSGVDLDERDALPSPEEFSVVTTTIFAGGSSATAGPTIESNSSSNSIPLAPIIGGAVGGVCLALIVVMGWMWWGSCIRRRDAEKRKEEVSFSYSLLHVLSVMTSSTDSNEDGAPRCKSKYQTERIVIQCPNIAISALVQAELCG